MYYGLGTVAHTSGHCRQTRLADHQQPRDAAAYAAVMLHMQQSAAGGRYVRRLESMTSYQKSDFLNRQVLT